MLDDLLAFGSIFDWITPVVGLFQDWRNRPSVGYNIAVASGWSAVLIRRLMTGSGVKVWGLAIIGDSITFRVRKAQARYAQYLLELEGIPYQGGIYVKPSASAIDTFDGQTFGTPDTVPLNGFSGAINTLDERI